MARPPALPEFSSKGPQPQCLCATGVQHHRPAVVTLPVPSEWWPGQQPGSPSVHTRVPLPSPQPSTLCSICSQSFLLPTASLHLPTREGNPHPALLAAQAPQKVVSKGRVVRWFWPLLSPGSCPGSAWNLGKGQRWGPSKPGKEDVRTPTREGEGGGSPDQGRSPQRIAVVAVGIGRSPG